MISNDDGYDAPGIALLTRLAMEYGDVFVAAPSTSQSGRGSAITIDRPLLPRVVEGVAGLERVVINGTPADCAKLALDSLLRDRRPRLVLSGINHGYNTGISSLYSGTVAVALEGLLHGVESIAFSLGNYSRSASMAVCEPVVRHVIEGVLRDGLPKDVCLNVNIPDVAELRGYKATTGAPGRWVEEFEHRKHPFGGDYYWMTGEYNSYDPDDTGSDLYAVDHGYVSVTPVHVDQTDRRSLPLIERLLR